MQIGDMNVILNMRRQVVGYFNIDKWMLPLEEDTIFKLRRTPIPRYLTDKSDSRAVHVTNFLGNKIYGYTDYDDLYLSYKKDLYDLGIRVERLGNGLFDCFYLAINLDDIAELPIDYDMVQIVTEKEIKKANRKRTNKIEGNER